MIKVFTKTGPIEITTGLPPTKELPGLIRRHIKQHGGQHLCGPDYWSTYVDARSASFRRAAADVLKLLGYSPTTYMRWGSQGKCEVLAAHARVHFAVLKEVVERTEAALEEIGSRGMTVDPEVFSTTIKKNVAYHVLKALYCEHCGADLTIRSRPYCGHCNPVFGNTTVLDLEQVLAGVPMPPYEIVQGTTIQEELMFVARTTDGSILDFRAPTRELAESGLDKAWRKRLRDVHLRQLAKGTSWSEALHRSKLTGTQTGRFSCDRPNNSNVPKSVDGKTTPTEQMIDAAHRSKAVLQRVNTLVQSGEIEEAHELFEAEASLGLKHAGWEMVKNCLGDLIDHVNSHPRIPVIAYAGGIKRREQKTS